MKIKINKSTIMLDSNEFWYFFHYLKNISDFYDKPENQDKIVRMSFPGTSLHLDADKALFNTVREQVDLQVLLDGDTRY